MYVYVARCCTTGKENTVIGQSNPNLNDNGHTQSEELAKKFATIPLDAIYCSPLARSFSTAIDAMVEQPNDDCFLITSEEITEQDYGQLTHHSIMDSEYMYYKANPFFRFPLGESCMDVVARVYPFMNTLKTKHGTHDRILIISHDVPVRVIRSYLKETTYNKFMYGKIKYGECKMYEF